MLLISLPKFSLFAPKKKTLSTPIPSLQCTPSLIFSPIASLFMDTAKRSGFTPETMACELLLGVPPGPRLSVVLPVVHSRVRLPISPAPLYCVQLFFFVFFSLLCGFGPIANWIVAIYFVFENETETCRNLNIIAFWVSN